MNDAGTVLARRTWNSRVQLAAITIAILSLAAVARFHNLRTLPPFIDESGHLYSALDYQSWPLIERVRFGKVFGYIAFYPMARFADDPLLAARVVIASLGVLSTLGVMLLTKRLATTGTALMAGLLWATMPYVVFHDRMALHDPLVSASVVWSTILLAAALDKGSHGLGVGAGVLLGLAILTKVTAILAAAQPVLLVAAASGWKALGQRRHLLASFAVVPGLAAAVMALGPVLGVQFGDQFVRGRSSMTWESVWQGVVAAPTWIAEFNSMPFALLAGATLVSGASRSTPVRIALVVSLVLSILGHAIVLKLWFSRYLLASLIPLVVLMSIVMTEWFTGAVAAASNRLGRLQDWKAVVATLATLALIAGFAPKWLKSDVAFTRNPTAAAMPPFDRYQYLNGWPSGYGLAEVVSFLNQEGRKSQKVVVIVGGFARPGLWMLPLSAQFDANVRVKSEHIFGREQLVKAVEEARHQPTFMFFEPPEYDLTPALLDLLTPKPTIVFEYKRRDEGRWRVYALDPATEVAPLP